MFSNRFFLPSREIQLVKCRPLTYWGLVVQKLLPEQVFFKAFNAFRIAGVNLHAVC